MPTGLVLRDRVVCEVGVCPVPVGAGGGGVRLAAYPHLHPQHGGARVWVWVCGRVGVGAVGGVLALLESVADPTQSCVASIPRSPGEESAASRRLTSPSRQRNACAPPPGDGRQVSCRRLVGGGNGLILVGSMQNIWGLFCRPEPEQCSPAQVGMCAPTAGRGALVSGRAGGGVRRNSAGRRARVPPDAPAALWRRTCR